MITVRKLVIESQFELEEHCIEFEMYAMPSVCKQAYDSLMEMAATFAPLDQWKDEGRLCSSLTLTDEKGYITNYHSYVTEIEVQS